MLEKKPVFAVFTFIEVMVLDKTFQFFFLSNSHKHVFNTFLCSKERLGPTFSDAERKDYRLRCGHILISWFLLSHAWNLTGLALRYRQYFSWSITFTEGSVKGTVLDECLR